MFDGLKRRLQGGVKPGAQPPPSLNDAYRLHRDEDVVGYTRLAADAFPHLASRIRCFGADWLGRQFATDRSRVILGEPQILLLEPGSGEIYEIPESFENFHGKELLEHPNEAVELGLFQDWIAAGGLRPNYKQCIGYKKPLFLGGEHEMGNLELGDFNVYWTICAQLLARVRCLPSGTSIDEVTIS